ncbi:MAG TPA: hypothetical protein DCO75_12845 [Fibrobacteres bacterium]|jgi:hypothetical protein|nr:hypothetical protein [Fibrobacterota bacterium]
MDHGVMQIIVGVLSGCVLTSGVGAILWALTGSNRLIAAQRHTAINVIAAECAEIDAKISSSDSTTDSSVHIRPEIVTRLEKIKKLLVINMQLLDVYYVKYIETLIARYELKISAPEGIKTVKKESVTAVEPAIEKEFAVELETGKQKPVLEDSNPVDFEKTQKFDFSKEKHIAEKKETKVIEKETAESLAEDFEIIEKAEKTESVKTEIPVQITPVKKTTEKSEIKPQPAKQPAPADKKSEVPDSEDFIVSKKNIPAKPANAPVPEALAESVPKVHPEDFISGDDLIEKIDVFFGIKD